MPETPMHENGEMKSRQDDVWFAGQLGCMQSEPESKFVQDSTNRYLGSRVLATNPAHVPAASVLRKSVSH
jgi:hypothetical protein